MGRVDFSHRLPLLQSPPPRAARQSGHHVVGEVGGAGVGGGQHVDVGEPIGGLSQVALAHQEDAERHQGREAGLPAGGRQAATLKEKLSLPCFMTSLWCL